MKYRIIIETEKSGMTHYYVQKRFLFFFWIYFTQILSMDMARTIIDYENVEEAENAIKLDIEAQEKKEQRKIVKREILNPNI